MFITKLKFSGMPSLPPETGHIPLAARLPNLKTLRERVLPTRAVIAVRSHVATP
jgi:hypothetical protein